MDLTSPAVLDDIPVFPDSSVVTLDDLDRVQGNQPPLL